LTFTPRKRLASFAPDGPVECHRRLEATVSWSTVEVARMSGVTSRTLRHYDEIGLLPPAGMRPNGYRYYEQDELLRLQQILVMRELDRGLGEIAAILDQQQDPLVALAIADQ
jgi:MerR family transcriptional regulator, thiopeptide resistance regulator